MSFSLSSIDWKILLKNAFIITASTGILRGLAITGYAIFLAVQAQGAPDAGSIELFATRTQLWANALTLFLTLVFSYRIAKTGSVYKLHHGLFLALLVLLIDFTISIFLGDINLSYVGFALGLLFAGLLGGLSTRFVRA